MPIDKNQVKKVAKLSRISLDDNKIEFIIKRFRLNINFRGTIK